MKTKFVNIINKAKRTKTWFKKGDINWLKYIGYISIMMATSTAISTLYFNNENLEFDFTSNGVNNLINILGGSIKLGAFGFFLITIYPTVTKINQTKKQLNISEEQLSSALDNFKFNNYYSHRDKFKEAFLNSDYIRTIITQNANIDFTIIELYNFYFSNDYRNFNTSINKNAQEIINKYLEVFKREIYPVLEYRKLNIGSIDIIHLLSATPNYEQIYNTFQRKRNEVEGLIHRDKINDYTTEKDSQRLIIYYFIFNYNVFIINLFNFIYEDIDIGFLEYQNHINTYLSEFLLGN